MSWHACCTGLCAPWASSLTGGSGNCQALCRCLGDPRCPGPGSVLLPKAWHPMCPLSCRQGREATGRRAGRGPDEAGPRSAIPLPSVLPLSQQGGRETGHQPAACPRSLQSSPATQAREDNRETVAGQPLQRRLSLSGPPVSGSDPSQQQHQLGEAA